MKTNFLKLTTFLLLVILIAASCRSSRNGCPGTQYSGPRFKAKKFSWDR